MRGLHISSFTRQAVSILQSWLSCVSSATVGMSMTGPTGIRSQPPPERVGPGPATEAGRDLTEVLATQESQVMKVMKAISQAAARDSHWAEGRGRGLVLKSG